MRSISKFDFVGGSLLVRCVAFAAAVMAAESVAAAKVGYVRSNVGAPWGANTNEQAMDKAFGVGQWDDLRYEVVDVNALFSPTYTFLYLEGSDSNASELQAFLQANQVKLEAWVAAGGSLFLNAAPNEGGSQNWGFGGVTLNYPDFPADPGSAIDPNHPIWKGPFLPAATSFTGGSFAHATVSGGGIVGLIKDTNGGNPHLAERPKGNGGCVIFGGLTTSNFWNPNPDALNLRANIVSYLAGCKPPDADGDGVPDDSDNCPADANPGQEDADGDGAGDVCDACPNDADDDVDGDGVCGDVDNCPADANDLQEDGDMDLIGDVCDACPLDFDNDIDGDAVCGDVDNCPIDANDLQEDGDGDAIGDVCDACPLDADNDVDADGVCGDVDNCPADANPGQEDMDGNGVGDVCDVGGTTGTTGDGTTGTTGDGTTGDATTGDATTGDATTGDATTGGTGDSGTGGTPTTGSPTTGSPTTGPADTTGEATDTDDSDSSTDGQSDDEGCGCRTAPNGPTSWLVTVFAGLLLRRRRRA